MRLALIRASSFCGPAFDCWFYSESQELLPYFDPFYCYQLPDAPQLLLRLEDHHRFIGSQTAADFHL